jgi:hypothetical protein
VTTKVWWERCFRIIAAYQPSIDIFEQVSAPADLLAIMDIEALTNPRILELHNVIRTVEVCDRCTGPGATFVMAPFGYPRPSRFTDGTFGVYYAADTVEAAIDEHTYHRAAFLADTGELPGVFEHRVIEATLEATLTDVARESHVAKLLDPSDYQASQAFGCAVYASRGQGLVWPSVRHSGGTCVGILKPRVLRNARSAYYLGYRWDGTSVYDVFRMESLVDAYPALSPTR